MKHRSKQEAPQANRPKHSKAYTTHLASTEWQIRRKLTLIRAKFRCERCGASEDQKPLQGHHTTYDRLGNEAPQDVQALCQECHRIADEERRKATEVRQFARRFNGWATARYGPGWSRRHDQAVLMQAFRAWLADRVPKASKRKD